MPVEEAAADETAVQAEEERILESEVTITYSYLYAGGKLLQETVTTGDTTETHNFFYDNTGKPYAMQTGGTTYYYVTNLQGDVVALLDASGNAVASYAYDPYGKVLSAEGTMAETNPLRYRGYYYDTESGLYYLQSRYYDPATCRFVNADNAAVIAVSPEKANWDKNLFAYCDNDPVNRKDDGGNLWHIAVAAGVGFLAGLASQFISDVATSIVTGTNAFSDLETYIGAAVGGAVEGMVTASIGPAAAAGIGSGVGTLVTQTLQNWTGKANREATDIAMNAFVDFAVGGVLEKLIPVKASKITAGRNSMASVYKSGLTKLRNRTTKRMAIKVMAKGVVSSTVASTQRTAWGTVRRMLV